MTSKTFIAAELIVALCGLAGVVLLLAIWTGGTTQVAALIGAAVLFMAGLAAAVAGLLLRRQQTRLTQS